jgi:hypothetical protein
MLVLILGAYDPGSPGGIAPVHALFGFGCYLLALGASLVGAG